MTYNRDDILAFWKKVIPTTDCDSTPIKNLTSQDYKTGSQVCPKCKKHVYLLLKIGGVWACAVCNSINLSKVKSLLAYKLTNDVVDYFGENITSDSLFDIPMIRGFVKFAGLEASPNYYLYFLSFIREVLNSEFKGLTILNFLAEQEKRVNLVKKEFPKKPESGEVSSGQPAG